MQELLKDLKSLLRRNSDPLDTLLTQGEVTYEILNTKITKDLLYSSNFWIVCINYWFNFPLNSSLIIISFVLLRTTPTPENLEHSCWTPKSTGCRINYLTKQCPFGLMLIIMSINSIIPSMKADLRKDWRCDLILFLLNYGRSTF